MPDDTIYWWINCKICGQYHPGIIVRPEAARPLGGKIECPDKHKSAEYESSEWFQETESGIRKLPGWKI
jgi:hypothetical protein